MIIRFVCMLLLFAIAGLNQPASAASSSAGKQPTAQAQQKSPGDAQIEHAIRVKLAKSKVNSDHFTVSVTKGVATIEGNTGVMQHKGVVTRIAKASGATKVENHIRISDAAKAKAAATLTKNRSSGPAAASGPSLVAAPPASIPRAKVLAPGSVQ